MLTYVKGDIFESTAMAIVNPINTVGVMGAGLALKFKIKYPEMFEQYKIDCKLNKITTGHVWYFTSYNKVIIGFPTKDQWTKESKIEFIKEGLQDFCNTYQEEGITSVAFPLIGCGLGGLDIIDVLALMEYYLKDLPINIFIYT